MDWQQKIIEADRLAAEKAEAIQKGRLNAISWEDLHIEATVLPQYKNIGRRAIDHFLGYIPRESVIIPFEPFLRAIIQSHKQDLISEAYYGDQLREHIKLIRNKDMEVCYNTSLTTDKTIFQNYDKTFVPFGQKARERLISFLGYEPQLKDSIAAEMWMRHMIASDTVNLPETKTEIDRKAIVMVKYREILMEEGREKADASELLIFTSRLGKR